MTLYVNACVRPGSRTNELARHLLSKICDSYTERKLYKEKILPLNLERLNLRTDLIEQGDYHHPMFDYAKEFAAADTIVIAAPLWDLSIPAMLKIYIENIYVTGIVSKYGQDGRPVGLCKADCLYFVTTSGGPLDDRFGFGYIEEMCKNYLGIKDVRLIAVENLDIIGNDPEAMIQEAKEAIV